MQDKLVGRVLGKYRIVRRIAQGGMATVYLGKHVDLDRLAALKVLLPALAQNQEFLQRFRREAMAAAKLKHKSIIHIYDFAECDGLHFMAMEYVEGGTLADRLAELRAQGRRMELKHGLRLVRQIAEALDYAHQHGIIHRDVKPSNVLIAKDGRPVLTDLGIAKAMAGTRLTKTMVSMGTPAYMSPEQGKGLKVDHRTDVYSLGVVLYELLAGRPPFQGDTPWSLVHQHVYERAPALAPSVPQGVRQIVANAIAKDREHRYPSAAAMARDLDTVLSGDNTAEVVELQPAGAGKRLPAGRLALLLGAGGTALVLLFLLFRSCIAPSPEEPTRVVKGGTATPGLAATSTSVREPTPTGMHWPQAATPETLFTADDYSMESGDCTVLRWRVEVADAIYLDDESVAAVGFRGVCLEHTTTYWLRVVAGGWEGTRGVTIGVRPPGHTPTIEPTGTTKPSPTPEPTSTARPTPSVMFVPIAMRWWAGSAPN